MPVTLALEAELLAEPLSALGALLWKAGARLNGWLSRRLGAPVLTHSFNFVARRPLDNAMEPR